MQDIFGKNKTMRIVGRQKAILPGTKEGKAIDDILSAMELPYDSTLILLATYCMSLGKYYGKLEERRNRRAKENGK